MPVSNDSKLDFLWKKVIYGVTETNLIKAATEENVASPYIILSTQVWQQADRIPETAAAVAGVVESLASGIELVADPTVTTKKTWFAVRNVSNGLTNTNRYTDFIPFTLGPSYEVKAYKDSARTQRLLPSTPNEEWVFDYAAGILHFPNNLPSGVTKLYLTGFRYIGTKGVGSGSGDGGTGGGSEFIGIPSDGSYDEGYVKGLTSGVTKISDAIDSINRSLWDLIPSPPPPMPGYGLEINEGSVEANGVNYVVASGSIDNTNSDPIRPMPGEKVRRVVSNVVSTSEIGPFGSSRVGTLTAVVNTNVVGSKELTIENNTGQYGALYIARDLPYPATEPGFHEALGASILGATLVDGLNYLHLIHSETGDSNKAFVMYDPDITTKPEVNSVTVDVTGEPTLTYSSGIPHYVKNTELLFGAKATKLATNVALASRNVEFDTFPVSVGLKTWALPGSFGLPLELSKDNEYTVSGLRYVVAGDTDKAVHATVQVKATARNANGEGTALGTKFVNVMRGEPGREASPIVENRIPVQNLGNVVVNMALDAYRVSLAEGNTPMIGDASQFSETFWDSTVPPSSHEASVVGGVIIRDRNNYEGFLPQGPDLSTKTGIQWITYALHRSAVSSLTIEVEGKFSGIWVALPGVTNLPMASNGWLNAMKPFDGYGVPGRDGNTDGCAVGFPATGFSQKILVTFGTESSTNSVNNLILVRFRLVEGDKITGLRFTGVEK